MLSYLYRFSVFVLWMGKNDLNTLCVDMYIFQRCRRGLSDLLSSCVCMSTSRTETHKNSVERHLM